MSRPAGPPPARRHTNLWGTILALLGDAAIVCCMFAWGDVAALLFFGLPFAVFVTTAVLHYYYAVELDSAGVLRVRRGFLGFTRLRCKSWPLVHGKLTAGVAPYGSQYQAFVVTVSQNRWSAVVGVRTFESSAKRLARSVERALNLKGGTFIPDHLHERVSPPDLDAPSDEQSRIVRSGMELFNWSYEPSPWRKLLDAREHVLRDRLRHDGSVLDNDEAWSLLARFRAEPLRRVSITSTGVIVDERAFVFRGENQRLILAEGFDAGWKALWLRFSSTSSWRSYPSVVLPIFERAEDLGEITELLQAKTLPARELPVVPPLPHDSVLE